jgi:hypothetical protein
MKKVIVIFLLFIFTIQTTKSLWIVTSFHVNRDYIAENTCINRFDKIPTCKGQCFLNMELSKEQKENKANITVAEKDTVFIVTSFEETDLTILAIVSNIRSRPNNLASSSSIVAGLAAPPVVETLGVDTAAICVVVVVVPGLEDA